MKFKSILIISINYLVFLGFIIWVFCDISFTERIGIFDSYRDIEGFSIVSNLVVFVFPFIYIVLYIKIDSLFPSLYKYSFTTIKNYLYFLEKEDSYENFMSFLREFAKNDFHTDKKFEIAFYSTGMFSSKGIKFVFSPNKSENTDKNLYALLEKEKFSILYSDCPVFVCSKIPKEDFPFYQKTFLLFSDYLNEIKELEKIKKEEKIKEQKLLDETLLERKKTYNKSLVVSFIEILINMKKTNSHNHVETINNIQYSFHIDTDKIISISDEKEVLIKMELLIGEKIIYICDSLYHKEINLLLQKFYDENCFFERV